MANIITYEDFVGTIGLPNTAPSASGVNNPVGDLLAVFITKYEAKYLSELMGYTMAKAFLASFTAPTPPVTAKWLALYSGAEFTDSLGRLNYWPGFRNSDNLLSIANYIYVKFVELNQSSTTSIGEVVPKTENNERISPVVKVCDAWNDMVDLNCLFHEFVTATDNAADYPDYPYNAGVQQDPYLFLKRNSMGI